MKKLIVFLFVVGLFLSATSPLMAGGVDNKHNFSAEYMRTLNRNAATDSADAVAYNPAGVVKMEDGVYVNLSAQYATKTYMNKVDGTEYEDDEPNIIPGLFFLNKKDRWAAFAGLTIPNGGGKVKYDEGNATTVYTGEEGLIPGANAILATIPLPPLYDTIKNQRIKCYSVYYGYTVGGAYALNDMVSVSVGARYIDAQEEAKLSITIAASSGLVPDQSFLADYENTAGGWGGIVGVNISPTEELNIGIRYETKTGLEFKRKVNRDDTGQLIDGQKYDRDLPGILALGAAYKIAPNLKAEGSFTYYLQEDVDWRWRNERIPYWDGTEHDVDNGYDLGIALEYTFNPRLKGSLGYLYTETGIDADYMTAEAPELDAHSVAVGFCYEAVPGLDLNFGLERSFYTEETTWSNIKLDKEVTIIALGIQYKFM